MSQAAMIFPGHLNPDGEKELAPDVTFYQASLENAVKIALNLQGDGTKVIISRGGTANAIRQAVEIPVINCEVTSLDLIDTLLEIKLKTVEGVKKVGLINYFNVSYDIEKLNQLLGLKIFQYYWKDGEDELETRIKEAKNAGIEVVLGAQITVKLAKKLGIQGYLMQVGAETVRRAVQKAREIIEIRHKDLAQSERISSLLKFAHEGIVSVDKEGMIDLVNPWALKILSWTQNELIGKHASKIFPNWGANESSRVQREEIASVRGKYIVYNRVPLIVDDQIVGGVVTFIDSVALVKKEQKIRTLLHAKGFVSKYQLTDIVGTSYKIRAAKGKTELYGHTDSTVLITGETGTGKELFAHSIHRLSKRYPKPFVAINCAALPENLLESELFGYEEGAFTGAKKRGKIGLFELSHRGTLLLDEISEMPLPLQSRLLRVLQEKEVMRLGGDRVIPVDVRIIASTNRNLLEAVEEKTFRQDLYFRLNILYLKIPSLRERQEDIPLLVEHFCNKFCLQFGHAVPLLSKPIIERLKEYSWFGNVRELENFVHRYAVLNESMDNQSLIEMLFEDIQNKTLAITSSREKEISIPLGPISEMQESIYEKTFHLAGKNKTKTAQILGVNRMTVSKKLDKK